MQNDNQNTKIETEAKPLDGGGFAAPPCSPQYEIESIGDFLKVPEERLEACLAEFVDYLEIVRSMQEMVKTLGTLLGEDGTLKGQKFVWIDDGKNDRNVTIIPVANTKVSDLPK